MEGEIANLKALELEALYEKCFMAKEQRIQAFSSVLEKIGGELESRDLAGVDTDKLMELYLKYSSQIRGEYIEPRFKSTGEMVEDKLEQTLLNQLTAI